MLFILAIIATIVVSSGAKSYLAHDSWLQVRQALGERNLAETPASDRSPTFDTYKFNEASVEGHNELVHKHVRGIYNSTGRAYSGYFASFHPDSFSFLPARAGGCTKLVHTSEIAVADWHATCEYATNGGFFSMTGPVDGTYCVGNLISQGETIQLPYADPTFPAMFGVTNDRQVVLGNLGREDISRLSLKEGMSGSGWLIRNGENYMDKTIDWPQPPSGNTFVTEKAPRTAVGWLRSGSMALLEVDGVEDLNLGPDLFEFTELALSLGFESLVNIDGGGSAVSVLNGRVISRPTCDDTGKVCERQDASIACVKK